MKDSKRARVQTTLGELIAALCEETRPFVKNEREAIIVAACIFNDLLRRPGSKDQVGEENCRRTERLRGNSFHGPGKSSV